MHDPMDGVLVVDKPSGPTSHDVVARARRALRTKRIGHTGTLDPLATGVLPLVIGRATRLASYLTAGEKSYEAGVRLGCATETYDAAERIAAGIPPPDAPAITSAEVEAALQQFRGAYLQAPPPYSAKKIGGVAAYRLARRNRPAQPASVPVIVTELRLRSLEAGLAGLTVTASAGFYVRSLAHDLGRVLECGAHLESLRRTRAGVFTLDEATGLETLESLGVEAAARLVPLDALLTEIPAVVLSDSGERRARHGNDVRLEDLVSGSDLPPAAERPVRLLDGEGRLLAVARAGEGGVLRPSVVLV
jgi:tRNA pseudouridine55 synthase